MWKMNPARSQLSDSDPRAIVVRIEPHAKGEVFTFEQISRNGRAETLSVMLYLDGKARDWQQRDCSGSLLSRRLDSRTVERGDRLPPGMALLIEGCKARILVSTKMTKPRCIETLNTVLVTAVCAVACCQSALAQVLVPTILDPGSDSRASHRWRTDVEMAEAEYGGCWLWSLGG